MSLGQLHTACDEQFRSLCEVSDSPSELQAELLEEASRYGLWAGNVGAGHPGQWSLEYRLREASLYRNEVSRILQILCSQLQKTHDLMNGVQLSIQDLSQEAKTGHHERNEDSGSDSSWGLSDTGSVSDQQISAENEGNSNSPDKMHELLQSIRLAISILYKLPLRRPAPMDRLRFGTMNEAPWFEGPDVAHVKDKFPDSRLPENVQLRLGKAITKRRQLLSYRRSHHEKLKSAHGWWDDASSQAMTKATTLCSDQMVPLKEVYELAPSVADSARTSMAASQSTREISIEVPPRPLDKNGQSATTFQCNYCQLTIHVMTDSSWRRHVIRDLQPYVCTFSECNLEDGHIFETENDWFEHEALVHRFKYFCNTPGHQKYTIAAEFQAHLKLDHSMDTEASKVALSVCKYPDNLSAGICDFCLVPSKNLKRHVSRHLRQLALFAISREDFSIDDEDADEKQGNLPRKAATSIHEDESTDTSSKAYESTSKSASEREGKSLLAPENDADLENGDEDSFSPDLSAEHYMDWIEDHKSFLSLGSDLAQPSIGENGASNKGKNPEVPSNATQHGVYQNTGNQEQLLGRTKIHNIPDESVTSTSSKQMGADEDKEDEKYYLRRARFDTLTAGDTSSDRKRRPEGIFVNSQRVLDLDGKNRSRAERLVIVDLPPRPRIPPKQFSTKADRSSQADSDLHKDCIPMKGENSILREDLRVAIARSKELENGAKILPDEKENLIKERLRLEEENVKLEKSMLPEDMENIKRRARANTGVSAEELQKRT